MNKSSVQLFNGQLFESKHAIEAYCHFLRLLMYFIDIYPELGKLNLFFIHSISLVVLFLSDHKINNTIENFTKDLFNRNKKFVPDIGKFLIQIALSIKYPFDQIKEYVYEEYFARQIY
jgi:hypothetical protein